MKIGKKAALAAGAAVVFLAACSGKAEEAIVSGEIVAPEISSEDLLVSSLEYLLLDDAQEEQQDSQEQEDTEESNEQEPEAAVNTDKSVDTADEQQEPEEVQGETATIYYGKGGSSDLKEETVILQEKTAEELISALAKHNIVSLDTKVLSFEEGIEDDRAVLYLDLSKAAGEYLRTMSKEAECIIVASIANTFVANYDAEAVYLMVEGDSLTTTNTEYTDALGRCTPEQLMETLETSGADAVQKPDAAEIDADASEKDSTDETQSKLPLIQEKE